MEKYFVKKLEDKLMLCSKDIQDGDKYHDYEGSPEFVHDKNDPILDENCFKVIGAISKEATWVKEGDEFESDQIQFILFYEQEYEQDTILPVTEDQYLKSDIGDKYGLSQFISLYEKRIEIKGPCGHFH